MARATNRRQLVYASAAADLDAELIRIAALSIDELREVWRNIRKQDPPASLSKDLIARALAHRIQEERLGALSPSFANCWGRHSRRASLPGM
jgi:hypothetical protein